MRDKAKFKPERHDEVIIVSSPSAPWWIKAQARGDGEGLHFQVPGAFKL